MKAAQLKAYRAKLPDRINVSIKNEDGGFWAKITTSDGKLSNCYTQADSISELVVMINDAVQTHFDIPEKFREQVGFYVPMPENHLRWEAMFNQMSAMQSKGGKKTTLTLRKPELVG
jgi:predicted RNase H-like HicB family nuclease